MDYTYDDIGQLTVADSSISNEDRGYAYDPAWNLATRVRITANADNDTTDHRTTAITYDKLSGMLLTATDPMGVSVRNVYDQFFRLTHSYKTPVGGSEIRVKLIGYSLGGVTSGVSANSVNVQSRMDGANEIDTWAYADGLGRIIETRTEAEAASQYRVVNTAYDERGEAFLVTWPRFESGSGFQKPPASPTDVPSTWTGYDNAGRINEIRHRVNARFDITTGRWTSKTDSTGDPGTPSPSPLAAKRIGYVHNSDPWWIVCTDEENRVRRYQLDAFGRTNIIHEVYDDAGNYHITTLTYDRAGNLTDIVNQNSEHIYYAYDDVGNVVAMADPHLGQWTYKRDRAGRLREQVDGKGQKVELLYNAPLKRLSTKNVYNNATIPQLVSTATYTYDASDDQVTYPVRKGQLFKIEDSMGWEKNGYDTRGRLQKNTRHLDINNQDYTATYTYNDADQLSSIEYPDAPGQPNSGPMISYEYHPSGALRRVSRPGPFYFYDAPNNQFDEFGHVLQFTSAYPDYPSKTTTRSFYATSKRLERILCSGVLDKQYHYNAADDVTYISGKTFTYDHLHRLQHHSDLTSGNFTYDAVGNITHNREPGPSPYTSGSAYTYGVRRTQAVKGAYGKTYLYDECGNMIVRGAQALEYDAENHLVRLSQPGTLVVEYGYAANGQRLWKRKNQDSTTLQVWIGNLYEEKDGKTLFHVFAGGQRICTFEPNSKLAGGTDTTKVSYYYHQDHLNSSSALTDWHGTKIEDTVWYPFGRTQTATPQATFQVSSKFTGQIFDSESGLYYYGARYYDPELGRFVQPDTIIPDLGNPQSYNRYAYCHNNPLKYMDPDGHGVLDLIGAYFDFQQNVEAGVINVLSPIPTQIWQPFSEPTTSAGQAGRRMGETIGAAMSAAEILGGITLAGGGAGVTAAGVPVTATGVGAPVGVPAVAVGAVATAGGAVVTIHGVIGANNYIFMNRKTGAEAGSGKPKTYQTYTKENPETGEVYTGKTSGTGTPEQNVARRDSGHHMNEKGFGPAKLDKSSSNADAIRGREQWGIKKNGGAKSEGGTSGNQNNSIGPRNKKAEVYEQARKDEFGD